MKKLYLIGIGPGNIDNLTYLAVKKINECNIIIGYKEYLRLIKEILIDKNIEESDVADELERANHAINYALEGKTTGVISSGDSGIYGMAGLILEIIAKHSYDIDLEIIPGITAINSAASLVGVPLMNDFCSISLSNKLTPENIILERVENAARGDFVMGLYNPVSRKRTELIKETRNILLKYRNINTPVAIVRNAYRDGREIKISNLNDFLDGYIDMFSIIIIGNSKSYIYKNYIITPRNYNIKYNL